MDGSGVTSETAGAEPNAGARLVDAVVSGSIEVILELSEGVVVSETVLSTLSVCRTDSAVDEGMEDRSLWKVPHPARRIASKKAGNRQPIFLNMTTLLSILYYTK